MNKTCAPSEASLESKFDIDTRIRKRLRLGEEEGTDQKAVGVARKNENGGF